MSGCNDPVAELLTRMRNASKAERRFIDISWSKFKEAIVKVLKNEGFVAHYLVKEEDKKAVMRVFLKFGKGRKPVLNGLKRMSKCSSRQYISSEEIPVIMGGMGMAVLSTSRGVLDGRTAKTENVGGELLCIVW